MHVFLAPSSACYPTIMRPAILAALLLSACASSPPARIRYAPPADPVACGRDGLLAAAKLASDPSSPCRPPVSDPLACTLATLAAALGLTSCHPVPVIEPASEMVP